MEEEEEEEEVEGGGAVGRGRRTTPRLCRWPPVPPKKPQKRCVSGIRTSAISPPPLPPARKDLPLAVVKAMLSTCSYSSVTNTNRVSRGGTHQCAISDGNGLYVVSGIYREGVQHGTVMRSGNRRGADFESIFRC